jgi:hypothetical protein
LALIILRAASTWCSTTVTINGTAAGDFIVYEVIFCAEFTAAEVIWQTPPSEGENGLPVSVVTS